MRATQPSITAENNAAVRAFESMRPAAGRICFDPFARFFISDELTHADNPTEELGRMVSRWNLTVPGVCDAILARTRFIDERLQEAIDDGLQQLVILGAGYDTRALRFDRLIEGVSIFELDHPATQQLKLQRLEKNGLSPPDQMTMISCRFDQDDISTKLLANGYDAGQKSFFIWEGVTYYLSLSEVDRTLGCISGQSPAGSGVVFDYFPPSVADGSCRLAEATVLRQALKQMGEEITFGIDPQVIGQFLSRRGLAVRINFTHEDVRCTYLKTIDRKASVSAMFYFVHATVTPANQPPSRMS